MSVDIFVHQQQLTTVERRAFLLGVIESASDITTHFDGDLIEIYDEGRAAGRELQGIED